MNMKEMADKAREDLARPKGFQQSMSIDLPAGNRQLKTDAFWEDEFIKLLIRSLIPRAFKSQEEAREHFDDVAKSILLSREHEANDILAMERVFEKYAVLISLPLHQK